MPDHDQVPFKTLDGRLVNIDAGLGKVLTLLKKHGVKTLYSCEGYDSGGWNPPLANELAYISMDLKSTLKLARRIRKHIKKNRYSYWVMYDISYFLSGVKELWLAKYNDEYGEDLRSSKQFFWYQEYPSSFRYEFSYDKVHGLRLTIRWDNVMTKAIEDLLGQTPVPKGRRWLSAVLH